MSADLAALAAAAQEAAPGPWSYGDVDSVAGGCLYDKDVMIASVLWDTDPVNPRIRRTVTVEQADAVGHYLAAVSPERVLALLAELAGRPTPHDTA